MRFLILTCLLLFMVGCGKAENEAERAAKDDFPGWQCPDDQHYYMVWRNPRFDYENPGPDPMKNMPSDRPVCIPWVAAKRS
jgi:hypothetical protein